MSDPELFVLRNGEQIGPLDSEATRAMVAAGDLSRRDPAWRQGLLEWLPLEQVIGFGGLPPLPATHSKTRTEEKHSNSIGKLSNHPPLKLLCGGLGMLLLLGSIFSVGGCVKAKHDLSEYWRYLNSPDGTAEVVLRSIDRGSKGDPFGQFFDMADTRRSLEAEVNDAELWATLCIMGVSVCAVGFFWTMRKNRQPFKKPTQATNS